MSNPFELITKNNDYLNYTIRKEIGDPLIDVMNEMPENYWWYNTQIKLTKLILGTFKKYCKKSDRLDVFRSHASNQYGATMFMSRDPVKRHKLTLWLYPELFKGIAYEPKWHLIEDIFNKFFKDFFSKEK